MANKIKLIPLIPDTLREAAQRGVLVPFVGAGASRIAGCPSWNDFADKTLKFIVEKGVFSHGQLAQINRLSPRIKLSIARSMAHEHKIDVDFRKILSPDEGYGNPHGRKLYGCLGKLGNTFVTTNYDEWLDEIIPIPMPPAKSMGDDPDSTTTVPTKRKAIYQAEDFTPGVLSVPDTVVHLHGSVLEPDSMVTTTQEYMRHYATDRRATDEENRVLTFLQYLFSEKTALFVGYGLEEQEILEYAILKARQHSRDVPVIEHYLLQGFFEHEYELMKSLKRYYLEECNIELIPFLRDQKDWYQLLDVLENLVTQIPAGQPLTLEKQKNMRALLDD